MVWISRPAVRGAARLQICLILTFGLPALRQSSTDKVLRDKK